MSKSSEHYDLCIQVSAQKKKVFELEMEVRRLAREKLWEFAGTDEGKRILRREFVEVEMEYMEEKEILDALQSASDIARRRTFKTLPSPQVSRRS